MNKKMKNKISLQSQLNNQIRERKILNIMCNTSILLMSVMTSAFTEAFTNLSKDMITVITTAFDAPDDTKKEIHKKGEKFQDELPKQIRDQLLNNKTEIITQLNRKKEELQSIIADKKFDEGIAIVDRYQFNFPALSSDLDERSLLGYLALLLENNESFTTMFQELVAWMKDLPQPK